MVAALATFAPWTLMAVLAALALGLPGDSRAFARTFGVEHALVLRAIIGLEEAGHLAVLARDPRTQRTRFEATGAAGRPGAR